MPPAGGTLSAPVNVLRDWVDRGGSEDTSAYVDTQDSEPQSHSLPRLEVRSSAGKGLGLFTCEHIPAYTRVVDDDALLSLGPKENLPELWRKYLALPQEDRQCFESLSVHENQTSKEEDQIVKLKQRGYAEDEARKMSQVSSKYLSNAFNTEDRTAHGGLGGQQGSRWSSALFPTIARINHSCVPNCHPHYNLLSGAEVLYTLRDIEVGEELSISYFDMTSPFATRQARAKSWGFTCSCTACGRQGSFASGEYEGKLALVHHVVETQVSFMKTNTPAEDVETANRAIEIASDPDLPWLVASLPVLHKTLALRLQKANEWDPERFGAQFASVQSIFQEALKWELRTKGSQTLQRTDRR
ncbi:uncharacterized protein LTR77_005046 [Saxophila tyrrhenica]|uniref:SET domain-containing protein n=1 Tax=Saxophila tyrrhenica TaxID=1690608 RepID=A0AAV9PBM6_9PEZI|nr:hypothetical protein LTR77_005046 [Saxophila tyrrhenica]